jgi:response regulator RpfG family c-di-GMP phosphodiesterase
LGLFAAIDLSLERERKIYDKLSSLGEELALDDNYFSITTKFSAVASLSVIFLISILFLVISRDLQWLGTINQNDLFRPRLAVIAELAFIGIIILAEVINLIFSFSKNLDLFISNENQTLAEVTAGNLSSRAKVASNDEFGHMANYTNRMIESLQRKNEELQLTRDVTILGLASLAETRDNETGSHILRTQRYVKALAEKMATLPQFSEILDDVTIDLLYKSAPMHDVGKVGVPDSILLKPGKLSDEEFTEMKKHTTYGYQALKRASGELGGASFLTLSEEIALTHHEKWDGSGYPNQLEGYKIPLSGRLMALADVYDALISKRVYKEAFSHEKAKRIIIDGRGTHFDPDVVDAFIEIEGRFAEIAGKFSDKKAK